MTRYFLPILRSPSCSFTHSTTNTMPCHLPHPRMLVMSTQKHPTPQTLQRAMRRSAPMPLTSWRNISRSSAKILRNATHLDGGGANTRIGLTCTVWPAIFSVFQVCSTLSFYHSSVYTLLGSAVAVERIFSSGRDTILIRHASLQPETIHTLMVLKHQLRQMREGNVIALA